VKSQKHELTAFSKAVLIKKLPFFIWANCFSPITLTLSGVSGIWIEIKSACSKSSSTESTGAL